MELSHVERRRGRRAQVQASVVIRRAGEQQSTPFKVLTKDVSLAGVYFETENGQFAVNDSVMASVAIPPSQTGVFPFKRLAGRSRVVRVKPIGTLSKSSTPRYGVALEFGDDLTVLTALPSSA